MPRLFALLLALVVSILPASAQDVVRLKVMSFNIWYGGEQVNFPAVAEAIKAAGADIVGLQETDGNLARLAAMTGLSHYDVRRNIISRFPIFDPALGERQEAGAGPYSMPPLDSNAVAAYVMVAPGRYVAVANTHLTSDPYGPDAVRDGGTLEDALQVEADTRVPEAQLLADGLAPLIAAGVPTFLTGDFNTPSHLDWTVAATGQRAHVKFAVEWPVSKLLADIGFSDSYRVVHPDAVAMPGLTWTAGTPAPYIKPNESLDRIDWVLAAHATALTSDVVGETGGPDVGVGIAPWPSDHRAVVSTFDVVPAEAPALIGVEPARVVSGEEVLIRAFVPGFGDWSAMLVPVGGDPAEAAVAGISGVSLTDRPTIKFMAPAPGAYDAVLMDGEGKELKRTRLNVVAADAKPTLKTDKASYAVGETIGVNWSDALGERFEWLGVYAAGEPNVYNYWGYTYTGGRVSGATGIESSLFGDPLPPGSYEIRLQRDDAYQTEAIAGFTVE